MDLNYTEVLTTPLRIPVNVNHLYCCLARILLFYQFSAPCWQLMHLLDCLDRITAFECYYNVFGSTSLICSPKLSIKKQSTPSFSAKSQQNVSTIAVYTFISVRSHREDKFRSGSKPLNIDVTPKIGNIQNDCIHKCSQLQDMTFSSREIKKDLCWLCLHNSIWHITWGLYQLI